MTIKITMRVLLYIHQSDKNKQLGIPNVVEVKKVETPIV